MKWQYPKIILVVFILSPLLKINLNAQESNVIKAGADSLFLLFEQLNNSDNPVVKTKINNRIINTFDTLLQIPASFDYPFDTLKRTGKITSPDEQVRIFSWYVKGGNTYKCYGIIQHKTGRNKPLSVTVLKQHDYDGSHFDEKTFDAENWPGMLYYKIIPVTIHKETYYTLLGFSFNDMLTNQKIIDIMGFNNQKAPFFGYPVFVEGKNITKRVVFTYSSQVVMNLNYNEGLKMIVYDHLSPQRPSLTGKYEFYGPDGSFDGLRFEDEKWIHISNVDIRSPKEINRKRAPETPSSDNLRGQ